MCFCWELTKLTGRLKRFQKGFIRKAGRNFTGKITAYHRGGGLKRKYRVIDFWRRVEQRGVILSIQKDPFRNALLGLVLYFNGTVSYIVAAQDLKVGDFLYSGSDWVDSTSSLNVWPHNVREVIPNGSTILLGLCPLGVEVFNIELRPGFGGQVCRAAGSFAIVVKKDTITRTVILKVKSGWFLRLSENCMATLGIASNLQYKFFIKRKAGYVRNFGRRPVVRGVAMNPIDHPHGGGEGKASGGKKPKTPWGLGTKGYKTVSKKRRKRQLFLRFK